MIDVQHDAASCLVLQTTGFLAFDNLFQTPADRIDTLEGALLPGIVVDQVRQFVMFCSKRVVFGLNLCG